MEYTLSATLRWQFDLTWMLARDFHLPHLTDEGCLWEPVAGSWSVRRSPGGEWTHDWSDVEPTPAPTVTVGWITWQMIWWWSGLIAASKGQKPMSHEEVLWPGSAQGVRQRLEELAEEWSRTIAGLSDLELERPIDYMWSEPQPMRIVVAWANSELMKNIAEMGILRHQFEAWKLHAQQPKEPG